MALEKNNAPMITDASFGSECCSGYYVEIFISHTAAVSRGVVASPARLSLSREHEMEINLKRSGRRRETGPGLKTSS